MKFYTLLLTTFLFSILNSQVIFFEDFDESSNSTTGTDSTGISWSTLTPYSVASSDYFEVISNRLEAKDTNGPATFETDNISVSCGGDVLVTMDLTETGTMEGSGCSVDYVKFEYSWDNGTTWKSIGDDTYGITTNDVIVTGCSGWIPSDTVKGPLLTIDDFTSFSPTLCLDVESSSLKLKVTIMNTAGSEIHRVDNIRAECYNCSTTLPVELLYFDAFPSNNQYAQLEWATATEINNDGFEVLRSTNGIDFEYIAWISGNGNQTSTHKYSYEDYSIETGITYYYRLKQIDYDGQYEYFNIESVKLSGPLDKEYSEILSVKYYSYLGKKFDVKPNLKSYIKCTSYSEGIVCEKINLK